MDTSQPDVTTLVRRVSAGDRKAEDELYRLVEPELRRLAEILRAKEPPERDWSATMLVNDAYLKLLRGVPVDWESRSHFYCFAARKMKLLAIDYKRIEDAERRKPPGRLVSLDDFDSLRDYWALDPADQVAWNDLLEALGREYPECQDVADFRWILGMNLTEIARTLHVSKKTVRIRLDMAEAWLRMQLGE